MQGLKEVLRILVVSLGGLELLDGGFEICDLLFHFLNFRYLRVTIRREIELL